MNGKLEFAYRSLEICEGKCEEMQEQIDALKAQRDALLAAQQWRDIESAPKDGSAVRLLISGGDFPLIDADTWETIGNFGVGEDQSAWTFAGWCWTHDEYRTGNGEVIGWLPLTTPAIAKARGEQHV